MGILEGWKQGICFLTGRCSYMHIPLKYVRLVVWVLIATGSVVWLIGSYCDEPIRAVLMISGAGIIISGPLFLYKNWRCPHCHALPPFRNSHPKHCNECGKRIFNES